MQWYAGIRPENIKSVVECKWSYYVIVNIPPLLVSGGHVTNALLAICQISPGQCWHEQQFTRKPKYNFVWSMHLSLLQLIWLFKSVKHRKTSLKACRHCKSLAASFLLTSLHHPPTLYHCHLPDHYQCYQMDQFKVFYQIEWIFLLLYMFYLVISWALPAWNAIN